MRWLCEKNRNLIQCSVCFVTAVIPHEIKRSLCCGSSIILSGGSSFRPTCQARHIDDASSGPPQQREENLTHLRGAQEVHVQAVSIRCHWLDLCIHYAMKDSCVIYQTPQACRYTAHQTTVMNPVVQAFKTLHLVRISPQM